MPSPIAHSIAGLVVAHFGYRRASTHDNQLRAAETGRSNKDHILWACAFVFAANAADLDFLPGFLLGDGNTYHHGFTHTLIAAVVFGLLSAAITAASGLGSVGRVGFLMGISYATHLLLDVVTLGTKEPYGMRVFWPFWEEPVMMPFHLFLDIRRDGAARAFLPSLLQWHNLLAVVGEVAIIAGAWAVYRTISWLQLSLNSTAPERKTPR